MVAYNFAPRFAGPILVGLAGGTIRRARRRHAMPGETMQLYMLQRTKRAKLFDTRTCLENGPIIVDWPRDTILVGGAQVRRAKALDAFAVFDGFEDYAEMRAYWQRSRPRSALAPFEGWSLRWKRLPPAVLNHP